jgi:hypothetical protein
VAIDLRFQRCTLLALSGINAILAKVKTVDHRLILAKVTPLAPCQTPPSPNAVLPTSASLVGHSRGQATRNNP